MRIPIRARVCRNASGTSLLLPQPRYRSPPGAGSVWVGVEPENLRCRGGRPGAAGLPTAAELPDPMRAGSAPGGPEPFGAGAPSPSTLNSESPRLF